MSNIDELKAVITALRAEGIEPIVDVEYVIGGGTTTTPPPPPPPPPGQQEPQRTISFVGTANNLIPTFDLPDVNSTKCLEIYEKRSVTEGVPPAGHKGMPKEDNLGEREAHAYNIFRDWAWIPRQIILKANGNAMSFPQQGINGADLSNYPGMWVRRAQLTTTTSPDWVKSIVEYLKTQW